jgi:hypothetical protein
MLSDGYLLGAIVDLDLSLFSTTDLRGLLSDLERTLQIVRRTIASLPQHEIAASRLIHIADLEEKRSRYQEELASRERDETPRAVGERLPPADAIRATRALVLFLAANPSETQTLALGEEARAIERRIQGTIHRDMLTFKASWAVRPDDLLQVLNEGRPRVVHFSGHGRGGAILLHSDEGPTRPVSNEALAALFRTLGDGIRVVVLNACFSRSQAEAITTVVPCAIGMGAEMGDRAACAFAASFYRAIGFGHSVQNAFDQGVVSLALEGIPGERVPVLLPRPGVDPSAVFVLEDDGARPR